MSLTRLDCVFHRGSLASPDSSSFVALNPEQRPGALVLAGACAVRDSIGSQVACKLSLEHFVTGVLDYFSEPYTHLSSNGARTERSLQVLESAFRNANSSVYHFGHQLAAGGRMAASLMGLVIEGNLIAAGRVGGGSAYLYRQGELYPFFDSFGGDSQAANKESYVGANSLISVELASVPIEECDQIYLFSATLSLEEERRLKEVLGGISVEHPNPCAEIVQQLFARPEEIAYSMLTRVGPDTIYLAEAV